jgi:hypothetical protein
MYKFNDDNIEDIIHKKIIIKELNKNDYFIEIQKISNIKLSDIIVDKLIEYFEKHNKYIFN